MNHAPVCYVCLLQSLLLFVFLENGEDFFTHFKAKAVDFAALAGDAIIPCSQKPSGEGLTETFKLRLFNL